jgi:coproporphyrinogen III oxidase-like Fe-S oxidoreductase
MMVSFCAKAFTAITLFIEMNIEQIFNQRKDDAMFNTSYPLKPADWNKWKTSQSLPFDDDTDISFYIHIPFCNSLCGFCEYVKFIKTNEEVEQKYLKIVEHDIRAFVNNTSDKILRGFDIGGGTPTILRWVLIIIFFEILIPPEPFMRDAPHFFYRKYNKNLL